MAMQMPQANRPPSQKEAALAILANKLNENSPDALNRHTELTAQEIPALALLKFIGKATGSTLRTDFCNDVKEMRVSLGRMGRLESISAFKEDSTPLPTSQGLVEMIRNNVLGPEQKPKGLLG